MKRIVVLIEGTWDQEGAGADTNVAKLDSAKKPADQAFIKACASGGIAGSSRRSPFATIISPTVKIQRKST